MKHIISVFIIMGIMTITGCHAIQLVSTFGSHPLVNASVKVGSNKQSVMAAGGAPLSKQKIINGKGDCWDYSLNSGDKQTPYYVSFNKNNMTTHAGFITCAEADQRKLLVSEEPVRQVY
nr:outer membrane protein assembly factor BamE [uncultured Moellerella sp.]